MKRALVIGGTGFLGLNLIDELLKRGVEVRATRRRKSITAYLRKRPVELVNASLGDVLALKNAMVGCDAVFHLAGYYPRYSLDRTAALAEATVGIDAVCEAALSAGVPRLVYTSSVGALGKSRGEVAQEQDIPNEAPSDSVYRAVKWQMERRVEHFVQRGLNAVTLLPGACLGPWDVRCGTGALLVGIVSGELQWWVDGWVNLVDVGDVAQAHVSAVTAPGSRYCVVGHDRRLGDLFETIQRRFGGKIPGPALGAAVARARAHQEESQAVLTRARAPFPREMVDLLVSGQRVSSARAERELEFEPRPLGETLGRAHDWFQKYGYIPAPGGARRFA